MTTLARSFPQKYALTFNLPPLAWLLLLALALRFAGLGSSAIWYDESYQAAVSALPFVEMIRVAAMDSWPPLWFIITKIFASLLGSELWALRLPSALFSLGALALTWRVGKELGLSEPILVGGVGALAVLPYQLWMAQDARGYAFLSALYLAAILFGLQRRWLGLAACVGLSLYTHFVMLLYLPALVIALLIALEDARSRFASLVAIGAGAMAFVPYLPTFIVQTDYQPWLTHHDFLYQLQALSITLFANVFDVAMAFSVLILLLVAIGVSLLMTVAIRRRPLIALATLALLPFITMQIVGELYKPILYYRVLSMIVAPGVLWLAAAWSNVPFRMVRHVAGVCVVVVVGMSLVQWSPTNKGSSLKMYSDIIRESWQPGDVVYHATATSLLPFRFYLSDKTHYLINDDDVADGLLKKSERAPLGIVTADLDRVPWRRAWIVWSRDVMLSPAVNEQFRNLTKDDARFVGRIAYWQTAPIEIWLIEGEHG